MSPPIDDSCPGRPAWDDRPPVLGQRWILIAAPRLGCPCRCVVLGARPVGVWLHWLLPAYAPPKGRSAPCIVPRDKCDLCDLPRCQARWVAYLSSWCLLHKRHVLQEITEHAVYTLPDLVPAEGVSLRGRVLETKRDGTRHNSPVSARWIDEPCPMAKAPPEADVRENLLRIWGYPSGIGLAWDDLRADEIAAAARNRAG